MKAEPSKQIIKDQEKKESIRRLQFTTELKELLTKHKIVLESHMVYDKMGVFPRLAMRDMTEDEKGQLSIITSPIAKH